jgi:hypothetical protein
MSAAGKPLAIAAPDAEKEPTERNIVASDPKISIPALISEVAAACGGMDDVILEAEITRLADGQSNTHIRFRSYRSRK